MRRQIKRVVATLLTASLIAPMCYGNRVSNAEMVKKNVTATAVDEDGSDGLTEITELHAASVDNKIEVRIWKNEEGKIFYSASFSTSFLFKPFTKKCNILSAISFSSNFL